MFAVLSMYFVVELQVSLFIIHLEEPIYREELIKKNKNVVLLLSQAEDSCGNNE